MIMSLKQKNKMVASFTNNAVMLLHMSETGWSEPVGSNILH